MRLEKPDFLTGFLIAGKRSEEYHL